MRFLRRSLPIALLTLSSLGCSSKDAPAPAARLQLPIIHGIESDASQNAVVLIGFGAEHSYYNACTGTLIAPNLVLTARHCVANLEYPDGAPQDACIATVTGDISPGSLLIYTGTTRTLDWITTPPQATGKKIFDDGATSLCGHDVALILLDNSITELQNGGIAPVRLDSPPNVGDTFTAVGWGITDVTDSTGVRMQRPNIPIDKVTATDLVVGESICEGDSGGPALSTTTGAILGVVSRGGGGKGGAGTSAAGCVDPGATNWYTGLWRFKTLILNAFAESTYDPWLEGQPDPRLSKFGAPCYTNPSCLSDLCIKNVTTDAGTDAHPTGGPSAPGWCTQSCDDSNPCPSGYDCSAYPGSVSDASVPDGGAPANVCTKHIDAPPPAQTNDGGGGGGGCAMSGEPTSIALGWPFAVLGLCASLASLRRRRR